MLTSYNEIKSKVVETKSGTRIGKVCDLLINTEQDFITHYEVKTKLVGGDNILISREQIIRHEQNKIIVDDNVKLIEAKEIKQNSNINPEPIAMSETN
ncbi:MAG: hypothetical protein A2725_02110 [Candidatus Magasanikbacteria bacterium RIFCSPHIGHO2_01_FULL_33_34]|uniref:PRC-barrel domain-containing protein n=1 Tax=Candidatus Magasanikbacteria bacterium RIFCSPHIGHO2_01_FULL_33_34 TaxID=1798671 RepID=A0A1F6LKD4_9BACT|nr:MAG: hypothetical protein A2725_02110 [Candidatus Magasanikbacteria bacterium RIFCSPHIGHO2_01_FULL_33_34]OGH65562.1 MAG: hypothetical protein A3B83_01685 [Candidatus Magasanikbacteria bacterium RIFCSPHIGHO2_02_FULL_33_17]OGH76272.1 MAG: hypothetical protein A3A89_02505 [Candidatus Magasanikbacteria bacterium RIFCSPLOWO2_01_FULL_33_34]OGH81432.1 MAG: hypothetical protein A3F93_02960 [Candidatus Magasanikbacteria bacterium RIFCSPLOWO2_12_FULL_34_7]